jgi:multidrug efflux pump subunit AcrA (membrane-fusion protein)
MRLFKSKAKFWVLGLALLTVAAATGLGLAFRPGGPDDGAPKTTPPDPALPRAVACFGHVDVEPGIASLYPVRPGRVEMLLVRENEAVKKGTVLLRLDRTPAEGLVRQARAARNAAEAQLAMARKLIDRQRIREAEQRAVIDAVRSRLNAGKWVLAMKEESRRKDLINGKLVATARAQCDELKAALRGEEAKLQELRLNDPTLDVRRAEAELAAKQAELDRAEWALAEYDLKAPGDGTVLRLLVNPGDVLGPQPRQPAGDPMSDLGLKYFSRLLGKPHEGGRVLFAESLYLTESEKWALDHVGNH